MAHIVIIEDETVLRSSLARGIAKIPGVHVSEAKDLAQALTAIDRSRPDLIISDIDLPGRSGIELLGELGRREINSPVIYVSAYLSAYRAQIPPHANVDVLEKPVALEQLRELIRTRLGQDHDDATTAPFTAADYIQLAGAGRHSVVIEIVSPDERGEIIVVSGEVWSAEDRQGTGNEAFRRLAFHKATVTCRTLRSPARERNIEGRWELLLMESARIFDEERKKPAPIAGLDPLAPPWPATPDAPTQQDPVQPTFDDHWDQAVDALLVKDYAAALVSFMAAREIRPADPKVEANLMRLHELGYSADSSGAVSAAPDSSREKR